MVEAQKWEYRVATFVAVAKAGEDRAQAVTQQFERMLNLAMNEGFEFWRMDHVSLWQAPGCLAGLLGGRQVELRYDVAIFRRPLRQA